MARIARIVPEVSLDRAFDYSIPAELDTQVTPRRQGARPLQVPRNRRLHRRVPHRFLHRKNSSPSWKYWAFAPSSPPILIELAQWMAQYYCAPLTVALMSVLPKAVRRADAAFKQRLWVQPLIDTLPEETVLALKRAKAQMAAWEHLQQNGPGWLADLSQIPGCSAAAWRGLAERNLVSIESRTQDRDPFLHSAVSESVPHEMNAEQKAALNVINEEITAEKPRVILLHGVTGSGKTEVYLQSIAKVLALGKSALVLVPEIALTPQTVERFRSPLHRPESRRCRSPESSLFRRAPRSMAAHICSGHARIVIGARSAVFAPLQNHGIIVVDEEHEHSYKQGGIASLSCAGCSGDAWSSGTRHSRSRFGHAVARILSSRQGRGNIVWSSCFNASRKARCPRLISSIFVRPRKSELPVLVAPQLIEAIQARIDRQEQSIIFLNRRGYSSSLQCPQCGHVEMCPNCSVALTFHRQAARLRCHLCDFASNVPHACPQCGFAPYKYAGSGTEKVEHALADAFPHARIARMDSDSMKGKDAYAKTLGDFAAGKIDLLLGTQMIAKGLDFPRVTCVGVINADLALQIPDFRASERVFQLLMQVSGRSGRGQVRGEVFVQTRVPFHPSIQFARHHDYAGFAEQELEFRHSLHYPPYERFILITARGRNEEKTLYVLDQLAKEINRLNLPETELTGPSPAPIARIEERYRFQIFLRTRRIMAVTPKLRPLFMDRNWPDDIRITLDVDPANLL